MKDASEDSEAADENLPRKRAAIGDGISAGSGSPFRESSPSSPGPFHSKARPTSGQFESTSDTDNFPRDMHDIPGRPPAGKLWQEGQAPLLKASFNDPSNIASIVAQKNRAQQHHPKPRKAPFQASTSSLQSPRPTTQYSPVPLPQTSQHQSTIENYEIVLQPETRPISQEQLVAEVKGIYVSAIFLRFTLLAVFLLLTSVPFTC